MRLPLRPQSLKNEDDDEEMMRETTSKQCDYASAQAGPSEESFEDSHWRKKVSKKYTIFFSSFNSTFKNKKESKWII